MKYITNKIKKKEVLMYDDEIIEKETYIYNQKPGRKI